MPVNGVNTLLETVRNVITTYKGTAGDGMSLADITKIARVEPITLVSSSLTGTKELYSILHGVLNIYAGYYLQAVSILSTQIYDSRILKILDKTNPDRDLKTFLTSGQLVFESMPVTHSAIQTLALDNAKYTLPMMKSTPRVAMESMKLDSFGYSEDTPTEGKLGGAVGKIESFEKLGLTVGKVIDVTFAAKAPSGEDKKGANPNAVTVPVIIKLDTMITASEVMTGIATANTDEITFGSRFRDAIAGRIGFIKDFLLCSDLIKAQKKTMIKDVNGFYSQLLKRLNNSKLYSALSGNISLSGISAIYVMSEQDESDIQRKIGGKLTNKTTRDIVFANTSAMMLVIVDKEWERVSIYVRDIDGFSQNSFDSFKGATDKGNNNLMDVMKAFSMNNPPQSF
jgi:hypothetical protein